MSESIDTLIEKLADPQTRHLAREALAEKGAEIAPQLLETVKDQEQPTNMRWACITLLAEAKYEPAGPELVRILKEEINLRPDALRALQTITGRDDVGVETDDWEKVIAGEELEEAPEEELDDDEAMAFLRKALKSDSVTVKWLPEGYAHLTVHLPGERKHQVLLTFDEEDARGRQVVTFYTECGKTTPEAESVIYRHNVTMPHGAFSIERNAEGDLAVVLRNRVPIEELGEDSLREIIVSAAREADAVEYELTEQDRI